MHLRKHGDVTQHTVTSRDCVLLLTSHPCSMSASMTSVWSASTARCRGVTPATPADVTMAASTCAPAASNCRTTCVCPFCAAKCRAVMSRPPLSTFARAVTSQRERSSSSTMRSCPFWLAKHKAVVSPTPRTLTSHPASISALLVDRCPFQQLMWRGVQLF